MDDVDTHARWAIVEWLIQQEKFARSVLRCDAGEFNLRLAASILLFTRMMRIGLGRYEEPESRRVEILSDSIREWKKAHPGQSQPPRSMLFDLGAEASRRAFRETYPALALLSDEIADMRRELDSRLEPANNLTDPIA